MSRQANDWAWSLNISAAQKLLLLSFCDRADEEWKCFPSIERVIRETNLDRKTVHKWVDRFVELGILIDTGERKGPTKRVKVYQINLDINPDKDFLNKKQELNKQAQISQEIGPNFPCNRPKFPEKQAQIWASDPSVEIQEKDHRNNTVVSGETCGVVKEVKKTKKASMAKLPDFDRKKVVEAWNKKAEQYGLPKIRAISISIEKGLLRLWKSYIHLCRELGRETVSAEKLFVGYIAQGYTPSKFACGDNQFNKKYGIDTALRQERIDQILQEVIGE